MNTPDKKKHNRARQQDGTPNPIDIHIGDRMRLCRCLRGLSQEKLAQQMGLTFQQIQKYEKGLNRVSASRLWDLCQLLQVDMNYFFEDIPQEVIRQNQERLLITEIENEIPPTPRERTSEAQELLCNYLKISNHKVAENIFQLVKSIATIHTSAH